ncbi:hypothetical protein IH575_01885 [Candidatus Dojkabacteria bacterium]|nr:hypothetical protein [Candidatus Dojkabacteria bacterium]
MKFDKYNRTARIYPSIIILIPFLIFTIYCDIDGLKDVFDDLLKIKIIGNLTIAVVLLYLLIQINRFLGKFLFEKNLFNDELKMPTTNFLLFSDSQFSKEYKLKIRSMILKDFKITLPDEQFESDNTEDTRKQIVEAVGLIRQKVKNGRLLLQHNIEYGFARNLIGGSVVGLLMSITDLVYFKIHANELLFYISLGLSCVFLLLLSIHKPIIKHLGNQYAKRLFQEYLQK